MNVIDGRGNTARRANLPEAGAKQTCVLGSRPSTPQHLRSLTETPGSKGPKMNDFRTRPLVRLRTLTLAAALAALAACGDNIAVDFPKDTVLSDVKADTQDTSPDVADTKADTNTQDAPDAQTDAVGSDVAAPVCGNGKLEGNEGCDDGDKSPGDGCDGNCAVEAGYTCTQASPSVCTDNDECTLNTDDCSANANCSNTPGSFTCACKPGYEGNGKTCTDVDECTLNTDDCGANATCTNTDGSFTCGCNSGYVGDGKTCTEVNPCEPGTFTCPDNSVCNKTGLNAYECICNSGFTKDGSACVDIDECATNADNCDVEMAADCTNTVGSFTCSCKPGYSGDGTSCSDIDECALDTDGCALAADCSNTVGSFVCDCLPGYEGDGFACDDINECATDADNCDLAADCSNTVGSFSCACKPGYAGDGVSCSDIDECTTGANNCAAVGSKCDNLPGSFSCACLAGYTGDGISCADIDECAANIWLNDITSLPWEISNTSTVAGWQVKDGAVVYSNLDGSPGYGEGEATAGFAKVTIPLQGVQLNYRFSLEIVGLADIETDTSVDDLYGIFYLNSPVLGEVLLGTLSKSEWFDPASGAIGFSLQDEIELSNLPFEITSVSFALVFDSGDGESNSGAGVKFTKFRFFQNTYNCLPESPSCTNTSGSYTCACPEGFAGDGKTACNDIDECALSLDACDLAAECTNSIGGYQCWCPNGYQGDGFTCDDVDECAQNIDACDMAADCSNTVGSYTCDCPDGYVGNGFFCQEINECNDFWITTPQLVSDLSWEVSNTSDIVGWHLDGTELAYSATTTTGYATGDQPNAGTARIVLPVPAYDPNREVALHIEALIDIDPTEMADHLTMTITTNTGDTLTANKQLILGLSFNGSLYIDAPLGLAPDVTSLVVEFAFDTVTPVTSDYEGLRISALYLKHEIDNCGENSQCTDLVNDFKCECVGGYEGNGQTCTNINECETIGLSDCVTNAVCSDFDGGHNCDCGPGFEGDGKVSCTPTCGNGTCGFGEDLMNCPQDCGPPPTICGNNICEGIEFVTCISDCMPPMICGNNICEIGESPMSCMADCGPMPEVCGDLNCGPGEDGFSCPVDCGPPPMGCMNPACDGPILDAACPSQCGVNCGDSVCTPMFESDVNCPQDCVL